MPRPDPLHDTDPASVPTAEPSTAGPSEPDTPRPASRRSASARAGRGRAVVDFRPYPTAPTRTRRSPANTPAVTPTRRPPTPASVWFTPAHPPTTPAPFDRRATVGAEGDHDEPWPLSVLTRAVLAFSQPGDHVLLLPWPRQPRAVATTVTAPTSLDHDPAPVAAAAAVRELSRYPSMAEIPAHTTGPTGPHDQQPGQVRTDLIVTAMPPRPPLDSAADAACGFAARALRLGGILAVLTHCHWDGGRLVDPTGPMVTAAQNADLLYLQHIVAVHLPPNHPRLRHTRTSAGGGVHQRVHSDVLVFTQPHDHAANPGDLPRPSAPDPQP